MARKLNAEEHETFNELLQEAELSGEGSDVHRFSKGLCNKSKAGLKLSPELGAWFGEDVSGLPLP